MRSVTKVLQAGLHNPRADREVSGLDVGIAHAMAITAEVAQLRGRLLALGVFRFEIGQCPDDFLHPVSLL